VTPCQKKACATSDQHRENKMEPEPNLPAMPAPLPVLAPMPLDGQVPIRNLFLLSFVLLHGESPSATTCGQIWPPSKKRVDERRRKHNPQQEHTPCCVWAR
jgi:hypothetical protein